MQKKKVVSTVCGLAVLLMLVPFALADQSASDRVGVFQNRPDLVDHTLPPAPRRAVTTPAVAESGGEGVGVFQGRPDLVDHTPPPAPRRAATTATVVEPGDNGVGVFQGRPDLFDASRSIYDLGNRVLPQ